MTDYIASEGMKGRRSSDILNDLVGKFPDTAKSRLQLIARTEVSKTQSALTQARAISLDLNWYIWRTSIDERVRSAHGHMEGVLVNWNDPPNPEKLFPQKAKPYGIIVCKNVPIARTGTQDYQGAELGISERPDEMFPVHRDESEVFDPSALASFEGVPLVDEHPHGDVTVDNAAFLMRGFVKDVRRGEGEDSDKMLADIIVTDPIVIAEIESGKREISCGYKCDYETDADGRIRQRNIRGNHIALVYKGRAGQDVSIKDSEPQPTPKSERRAMFMKTQSKDKQNGGFLAKLFGVVTADADPAVVAELAEHLLTTPDEDDHDVDVGTQTPNAALESDAASAPTPAADDTPPAWAQALIAELAALKESMSNPKNDPLVPHKIPTTTGQQAADTEA